MAEPELKTAARLDTRDYNKGVNNMKQGMKDLNKVSSDAFSSIGNALGVDTGKLQQFYSALSGVASKFQQVGKDGTQSFSAILKSMAPVASGIAGLGIAAAIALFKKLNEEADAFETTIEGGIIKAQTEAYVSTFTQVLRDMKNIGQMASESRSSWRESWTRFLAGMNPMNNLETLEAADQAGRRAKEIAAELYEIDLKRKNLSIQISEIDTLIAQKREIVSDSTKTTAERASALVEAQELIRRKLELQLPLAEQQRDLIIEYNGLASDTMKDLEAEIAAKINVNNLIAQESAEQRQLLRQQKTLNAELQKEIELRNKTRGGNLQAIGAGPVVNNTVSVPTQLLVPSKQQFDNFKSLVDFQLAGMDFQIGIELDAEKWQETAQRVADGLKSAMVQGVESLGAAVGALLGDLATGQNGWENFANAAISAFGDMAISMGKIAIEAGAEVIALNAALSTMSVPAAYMAMAAGTALVLLGSAVKTGMANIANGNYSSTMSMASSASSSIAGGFEQRDVYVNVQGTLVADGDQLLAVINNTDKKNYFTT